MTDPMHCPRDHELYDVLDAVMQSFLHIEAAPTLPPSVSALPGIQERWNGMVAITGAFNGAVIFRSSRSFAFQAASTVFGPEEVDGEAARDVIAEITNMLGGNIKSCFATDGDNPCHLSLPFVSASDVTVPHSHLVAEVWAHCRTEPVCLSLFRADSATGA